MKTQNIEKEVNLFGNINMYMGINQPLTSLQRFIVKVPINIVAATFE